MFSDHNGLVASWGTDWPVNDTVKYKKETVGLATYIPKKYVVKETSDKENFLYTISAPGKSSFRYYTSFTSARKPSVIPTRKNGLPTYRNGKGVGTAGQNYSRQEIVTT